MQYTKPFYIVVDPPGSLFAKRLQSKLRELVTNKIYRRRQPRQGRSFFKITPQGLNKIEQFHRFSSAGVSSPRYATSPEEARLLDCRTLFARTLINSTNGRGILEFDSSIAPYPAAPLYTEYIPKKSEFRFHVFGDQVIDIQEKRKAKDFNGERNTRIRNVGNGYVYCRDGINPPDGAANLAVLAVKALGYEYGAVDVIYNEKRNQSYVLEVNSRPGLMGTTLEKYAEAIINLHNLRRK